MDDQSENAEDTTYPVRVASRMTGLRPELIRAWEARYGAIRPQRTAGGSRRYTDADLQRLKLLRDVVAEGHRIGGVARLDREDLEALLPRLAGGEGSPIERLLGAIERLDASETRRRLIELLAERDCVDFAVQIALPLLDEIGERWSRGDLGVSNEHFATTIVRSLLVEKLNAGEVKAGAPRIVLATPGGEPHDFGTLVASLVAQRAGADVVFLGADVPAPDLVASVEDSRALVAVVGIVTMSAREAGEALRVLRSGLDHEVQVWVGGPAVAELGPVEGIEQVATLEQLEAQVTLLVSGIADAAVAMTAGGKGG